MRPSLRKTLARILRARCPRCGEGPVFERGFLRAQKCSCCEWEFERGQGFWIGGSEVHMFASYGISVVLFIPLLIILGSTPLVQTIVIAGHVLCSVALLRFSRAAFIGIDYYIDPGATDGDDDDRDEDGVPVSPKPRRPLRRQKRRVPADVRRPAPSPLRTQPDSARPTSDVRRQA